MTNNNTKNNGSKNNNYNNEQQSTNIKKPLPSGTITTIRSSMFELGSTNNLKNN